MLQPGDLLIDEDNENVYLVESIYNAYLIGRFYHDGSFERFEQQPRILEYSAGKWFVVRISSRLAVRKMQEAEAFEFSLGNLLV